MTSKEKVAKLIKVIISLLLWCSFVVSLSTLNGQFNLRGLCISLLCMSAFCNLKHTQIQLHKNLNDNNDWFPFIYMFDSVEHELFYVQLQHLDATFTATECISMTVKKTINGKIYIGYYREKKDL